MNFQDFVHWVYVAGMALGAIYFLSLSRNPQGVPRYEYGIATFIPIWSGLAYMAMAINQGKVEVAAQIAHYARYADWIVTTPLLLLALGLTAMHRMPKDWVMIASLMATQVVVVATGLIADISAIPEIRYLWYLCGVSAFLVVMWGLWGPMRKKTLEQGADLSSFFNKLLIYFTVLWIGYPLVWIVGPSGLGLINQDLDTLLFCVLPFFSKVGFSFLDLHGLRNLNEAKADSAPTGGDRIVGNLFHIPGGYHRPKHRRLTLD
ncbi:bacteriorhodopsin [Nodosilinea sp. PGN35]|uniref:bacteriorhodopsin n=1 Tax=Nodosilinea sp. PGN35 TaxID=3020489 RepID=UPI0023B27A9D|nr:bacteriorhodopsin [Nodosilinea sp. TSF1-S3]MDF0367224.1 bacteriorhodopsin [Nodosilinea sp. TSF1-S3]